MEKNDNQMIRLLRKYVKEWYIHKDAVPKILGICEKNEDKHEVKLLTVCTGSAVYFYYQRGEGPSRFNEDNFDVLRSKHDRYFEIHRYFKNSVCVLAKKNVHSEKARLYYFKRNTDTAYPSSHDRWNIFVSDEKVKNYFGFREYAVYSSPYGSKSQKMMGWKKDSKMPHHVIPAGKLFRLVTYTSEYLLQTSNQKNLTPYFLNDFKKSTPFLDDIKHYEIKKIGCGKKFSIILTKCGRVYSYGGFKNGQLGIEHFYYGPNFLPSQFKFRIPHSKVKKPQLIHFGTPISDIAVGNKHGIAYSEEKQCIFVWGSNEYGQLGITKDTFFSVKEKEKETYVEDLLESFEKSDKQAFDQYDTQLFYEFGNAFYDPYDKKYHNFCLKPYQILCIEKKHLKCIGAFGNNSYFVTTTGSIYIAGEKCGIEGFQRVHKEGMSPISTNTRRYFEESLSLLLSVEKLSLEDDTTSQIMEMYYKEYIQARDVYFRKYFNEDTEADPTKYDVSFLDKLKDVLQQHANHDLMTFEKLNDRLTFLWTSYSNLYMYCLEFHQNGYDIFNNLIEEMSELKGIEFDFIDNTIPKNTLGELRHDHIAKIKGILVDLCCSLVKIDYIEVLQTSRMFLKEGKQLLHDVIDICFSKINHFFLRQQSDMYAMLNRLFDESTLDKLPSQITKKMMFSKEAIKEEVTIQCLADFEHEDKTESFHNMGYIESEINRNAYKSKVLFCIRDYATQYLKVLKSSIYHLHPRCITQYETDMQNHFELIQKKVTNAFDENNEEHADDHFWKNMGIYYMSLVFGKNSIFQIKKIANISSILDKKIMASPKKNNKKYREVYFFKNDEDSLLCAIQMKVLSDEEYKTSLNYLGNLSIVNSLFVLKPIDAYHIYEENRTSEILSLHRYLETSLDDTLRHRKLTMDEFLLIVMQMIDAFCELSKRDILIKDYFKVSIYSLDNPVDASFCDEKQKTLRFFPIKICPSLEDSCASKESLIDDSMYLASKESLIEFLKMLFLDYVMKSSSDIIDFLDLFTSFSTHQCILHLLFLKEARFFSNVVVDGEAIKEFFGLYHLNAQTPFLSLMNQYYDGLNKDVLFNTVLKLSPPHYWTLNFFEKDYATVNVFTEIRELFNENLNWVHVIERIEHRQLWLSYVNRRNKLVESAKSFCPLTLESDNMKELGKDLKQTINEKYVFFYCTNEPQNISKVGFKNHFVTSPYCGHALEFHDELDFYLMKHLKVQKVYVCRVILGNDYLDLTTTTPSSINKEFGAVIAPLRNSFGSGRIIHLMDNFRVYPEYECILNIT